MDDYKERLRYTKEMLMDAWNEAIEIIEKLEDEIFELEQQNAELVMRIQELEGMIGDQYSY